MASSRSSEEQHAAVPSDEDTVVLGDNCLRRIVDHLGKVYFQLGLLLNLTRPAIEQLEVKFPNDLWRLNFEVLVRWRDNNRHLPNMINGLIEALKDLGLNDVVEVVRDEEVTQLKENIKQEKEESRAFRDEVHQLKETIKREQELRKATEASSPNNQQRLLVVGGMTPSTDSNANDYKLCHYWDNEKKHWQPLTTLPQLIGRFYGVCQVASDLLLLTGGSVHGAAQGDCWQLNLVNRMWTQLPSMTTPRKYHRSVLIGDCVIVVGGKDGRNRVTRSAEQFNLNQRQWSSLPAMPWPVIDPATTSHGHKVFVFGGRDADDNMFLCTQAYDTMSGQWLTLGEMPEVCRIGAALSLGQYVYVVGGFYQSCLRYDPATDSWTKLSQPRLKHKNAPAVVWQGGILVAGGGGPQPESAEIEYYNPETDEWSGWQTPLVAKLISHHLFSVTLPGV